MSELDPVKLFATLDDIDAAVLAEMTETERRELERFAEAREQFWPAAMMAGKTETVMLSVLSEILKIDELLRGVQARVDAKKGTA
jgi:hypothetical protein